MSDYSELKRLAEAATPGPWVKIAPGEVATADYEVDGEVMCDHIASGFGCGGSDADDAAFVAAANPAAVLALIAENERIIGEEQESSAVVDRLSELLAGVSIAVRGPYLPLQRHSYHDLPQRVEGLVGERDQLKAEAEALRKENKSLRGSCEALGKDYKQAKRERNAAIRENGRIKNESEALRAALIMIRDNSDSLWACETSADALIDSRK